LSRISTPNSQALISFLGTPDSPEADNKTRRGSYTKYSLRPLATNTNLNNQINSPTFTLGNIVRDASSLPPYKIPVIDPNEENANDENMDATFTLVK